MLARIIDNQLQIGLPTSAKLLDGMWVSNYELLPPETLTAEGWKEVTEANQDCGYGIANYCEDGTRIVIEYEVANGDS